MRKFLILVLLSPSVFAATANVSWVHPTQYTDGTTLALENIKATTVQYGTCTTATTPTFGTLVGEVVVPAPANTTTVSSIVAGAYCWRAKTTDLQDRVSVWSVVIARTITEPKPKAPTSLTIQ